MVKLENRLTNLRYVTKLCLKKGKRLKNANLTILAKYHNHELPFLLDNFHIKGIHR